MFNVGFELEVVTEIEKSEMRSLLKNEFPSWHRDIKVVRDYTFAGWELVTKPYKYSEAQIKLEQLLKFISTHEELSTDKTTALHINISHIDNQKNKDLNIDSIYHNLDIHKILKKYGRVNNNYTRSPKKYMFYSYLDFNTLDEITSFLNNKDVQNAYMNKLRKKFEAELAENRKNIPIAKKKSRGLTYFEFRMIGGVDYNKKLRSIKNDMANMCASLATRIGV
mgnify:CR=1 FL=1